MFDHEKLERFDPDQYRIREEDATGQGLPVEDEDGLPRRRLGGGGTTKDEDERKGADG
jgi:hypothetical protein